MCWSPTADLVAGGAIAAVGAACIASTRRARDLPLATLPLLLGVHQLVESVVWRNADNAANAGVMRAVGGTAVSLWAVIAYPLLPALVPLAVALAASSWSRLRLAPFVLIGLATAAMLGFVLASGPVTARAVGHTMRYSIQPLPLGLLIVAGYLVATVGALLVSDQPEIRVLGLVAAVGAGLCYALWREAFVSTWCALAAVASALILHWLRRPRKRRAAPDSFRRTRVPAR
jgi:hypothetical protein